MPAVVLTGAARDLRRRVGPVAWAVLEDVALDAVADTSGCLVAATNVRRVADQVGVSKDTAAAALTRLARLGLVERRPALRAGRGRFGRSVYLVRLDAADGVTRLDSHLETRPRGAPDAGASAEVETSDHAIAGTGARPPVQRRRRRTRSEQSSLFDDEGHGMMTGPRPATDADLRTVATTSTTSTTSTTLTTDRQTGVTRPAADVEMTAVLIDVINDQDERTHWHPAVPNCLTAVPAVSPSCGGGGC